MVNFHRDMQICVQKKTEKVSCTRMCNFDNCESGINERGMRSRSDSRNSEEHTSFLRKAALCCGIVLVCKALSPV
jgi:hypothetical protein